MYLVSILSWRMIFMKVIIDRFEGDYAICETDSGDMIHLEINQLPSQIQEGDILIIDEDSIRIDQEKTSERRKKIQDLMDDLWK